MQSRILSLQAHLIGGQVQAAKELVDDFYRTTYGPNSSITPGKPVVHLATFEVPAAHWLRWQDGLGELQSLVRQSLPETVGLSSEGETHTMAATTHWGFRVNSPELVDVISSVRGTGIEYLEVSGYQPFFSLLQGSMVTSGKFSQVRSELNDLLGGESLLLEPGLKLMAGQLQTGNLRTKLNPYQVTAKALLRFADVYPGATPELKLPSGEVLSVTGRTPVGV
jgi:hypothetical protein